MFAHDKGLPTDTLKRMNKTKKEYRRASDLTPEEVDRFRTLNRFLKAYEKKILHEVESLYDYAMQKTENPDEWMEHYEGIELRVHFSLKENDKDWDEDDDDDNVVVAMMSYILESPPPILGGTEDHTLVNIAPDIGEMHCWMFHALYDHSHLSWDDMLRIGSVELECILTVGSDDEKI